MIDGDCVYFCQLRNDALECGLTRNEEASRSNESQQKIFTLFLRSSSWCESSKTKKKIPKFVFLCLERSRRSEFPITTKINIFFISETFSRAILALQPQEHSSLIPEKSLLRCNMKCWEFLREDKRRREEIPASTPQYVSCIVWWY